MRYYRALKSMMAPVDVITADRDFSNYAFVVAPAYQLVSQDLIDRWTEYARNGGHLILTCRTAEKDRNGHLWEALWAQPIYTLIGGRIPFYDDLPDSLAGTVTSAGQQYKWGSWAEVLEPDASTEVLARYTDQYYAGRAAAITHKFGKGTVTYVGVDTLNGDLERAILHRVYEAAGAAPANLDEDFQVDWRDGFWVATNFTSKPQRIPAAPGAHLRIGSADVPPGGVAVWTE
jgi:beta-galactosidase